MQIDIAPYSSKFPKRYEKVKEKIFRVVGKKLDIHHIGSTAVPNLGGKGIIGVLVGVKNWKEGEEVVKKLKKFFPHVHPKEKGRIFLSNKKKTIYGDVHIHIVRKGTKQYENFLKFVDYLKKHKKEREKYFKFKKELVEKVKGDKEKYCALKGKYIKSVLKLIKVNK